MRERLWPRICVSGPAWTLTEHRNPRRVMIRRLRSFACSACRGFHSFPSSVHGLEFRPAIRSMLGPMGLKEHRAILDQAQTRLDSIKVSL